MSFLKTTSSIHVLYPSMTVATTQHTMAKFFISGSEKEYSLNMNRQELQPNVIADTEMMCQKESPT